MPKRNIKNKKIQATVAFIAGLILLKIAFSFLGSHLLISNGSIFEFMTSVLNTENIITLTNSSRKTNNIPGLHHSKTLEVAAQKKAEDMLRNEYFSHNTPGGKTPWDFIDETGYGYLYAGENLAIHFDSAESVIAGWLTSPGHRKNILNEKYTEIGIGVARGTFQTTKTTIIVQMFARPVKTFSVVKRFKAPKPKTVHIASLFSGNVKGASIEKNIKELQAQKLAEWNPGVKTSDIFAGSEKTIPASVLFRLLYPFIVIFSTALFVFRLNT